MKKIMKNIAAATFAVAALAVPFAALAAADGDIFEIRPVDVNGAAVANPAEPLDGGETARFAVRLAKPSASGNMFRLVHTGLNDADVDWVANPPAIGIFVNGEFTLAYLESVKARNTVFTDFIFTYTVKPGDFAMPIRLAGSDRSLVTDTTQPPDGYYLNFLDSSLGVSAWKVDDSTETTPATRTANFVYGTPGYKPTAPESDGRRLDYDLSGCGFNVKTVDFDANDESTTYWRTFHEHATESQPVGAIPSFVVSGVPESSVTLYVWSENEAAAVLIEGRDVAKVTTRSVHVDQSTTESRQVAEIKVVAGKQTYEFNVRGVAQGNDATIVMSAFPDFNYNAGTGDRLDDYLTRTVRCVEPMPASVTVKPGKSTVTATSDYTTYVTELNVALSENPIAHDFNVLVEPGFTDTSCPNNWWDYFRLAATPDADPTLATPTTYPVLVFKAGETKPATLDGATLTDGKIYLYALRSDDYVTGAKKISFKVTTTDADAVKPSSAGGIDGWDAPQSSLTINAQNPVVESMFDGTDKATAVAGAGRTLQIVVSDVYADMQSDAGYEIWIEKNTDVDTEFTKIDGLYKPGKGNVLYKVGTTDTLPTVTYNEPGDISSTLYVVSPVSRNQSANHNFTVTVTTPAGYTVTTTDDVYDYNEGDPLQLKITLDKQNTLGDIYAYIKGETDADTAAIDCTWKAVAGGKGRKLANYATSLSSGCTLVLLDGDASKLGSTYSYEVVFLTQDTWTDDSDKRVTAFRAKNTLVLTTHNVIPTVDTVTMGLYDIGESGSTVGGETNPAKFPVGIAQTFTLTVEEPGEIDKDPVDPGDRKFQVRWKFTDESGTTYGPTYPTGSETSGIVEGNPDDLEYKFDFPSSGKWTVTIDMRDKDMGNKWGNGAEGKTFVFYVYVIDQPAIKVTADSSYNEQTCLDFGGEAKIDVDLELNNCTFDMWVNLVVAHNKSGDVATFALQEGDDIVKQPDGSYNVKFGPRVTHQEIFVQTMDGTPDSRTMGFKIVPTMVPDTTHVVPNSGGKHPHEYYVGVPVSRVLVYNDPPLLDEELDVYPVPSTNAIPASIGAADEAITWSFDDVALDFSRGITVEFKGGGGWGPKTYTDRDSAMADGAAGFVPTFGSSGPQPVKLTVKDPDGGVATVIWNYEVEASKSMALVAHGPASGNVSKYDSAAGLGQGRVWAESKSTIAAKSFSSTINCGLSTSWSVYGYGYKVGDIDDGATLHRPDGFGDYTLGYYTGRDTPLDVAGANLGTGTPFAYAAPLDDRGNPRDSFLYAWMLKAASKDGGTASFGFLNEMIAPEYVAVGSDSGKTVDLPSEVDDKGNYAETTVEGIFSVEFLASDNCGDINLDGIPDAYVNKYGFGIVDPESGQANAGSDLVNLGSKDLNNTDADFLPPADTSAYGTLIPGLAGTWATVGRPFTAKLEIRGNGDALNDAPENNSATRVANLLPDRVYTDPGVDSKSTLDGYDGQMPVEYLAWLDYAASKGLDPDDKANWTAWSPERPTDPTVDDTDGDGLPDGYEYFIWYRAHVGYNDNGVHRYLTGRAYDPRNPGNGKFITSEDIAEAFDPAKANSAFSESMDTDNDGLPDLIEFAIGTNPIDFDTDGDGLPDGYEIMIAGTDPLLAYTTTGICDAMRNYDGDAMAITSPFLERTVVTPTPKHVKSLVKFALVDPNGYTDGVQWYVTPFVPGGLTYKPDAGGYVVKVGADTYVTVVKPTVVVRGGVVRLAADLQPSDTWLAGTFDDENGNPQLVRLMPTRLVAGTVLVEEPDTSATTNFGYVTFAEDVAEALSAWPYGRNVSSETTGNASANRGGFGFLALGCYKTAEAGYKLAWLPETDDTIAYLHHQVYQEFGFDPRTAWNANTPLGVRWGSAVGGLEEFGVQADGGKANNVSAVFGYAAVSTRTREFTLYDEFLLMSFFLNGLERGLMHEYATTARPWYTIWSLYTTNGRGPNEPDIDTGDEHYKGREIAANSSDDNGADTDGDGVPDGWELYVMTGPKKQTVLNGVKAIRFVFPAPYDDGYMSAFGPFVPDARNSSMTDNVVEQDLPKTGYTTAGGDGDDLTEYREFAGTDTTIYYSSYSTTITRPEEDAKWLNKFFPTDPWNADTDGDGLTDKTEASGSGNRGMGHGFVYGTPADNGKLVAIPGGGLNPLSVDTDYDGLPDGWEFQFNGETIYSGDDATYASSDNGQGNPLEGLVDGMDGTVRDAFTIVNGRLNPEGGIGTVTLTRAADGSKMFGKINRDYDNDGLENWQEYMVGTMRCWRYDDILSAWDAIPDKAYWNQDGEFTPDYDLINAMFGAGTIDTSAADGGRGEFWYKTLVDRSSPIYNPRLLTDQAPGDHYLTRVTNGWDPVFLDDSDGGAWYYMYNTIDGYALTDMWVKPFFMESGKVASVPSVGPTKYISCSPIDYDSDHDGMDDYYELFHGLNPLLGGTGTDMSTTSDTSPCDLVSEAWGGAEGPFQAWLGGDPRANYWTYQAASGNYYKTGEKPRGNGYDFEYFPWLNGLATADPDGDDVRNQNEAIMPKLASSVWHHTDPSPLWMTDSTYPRSLTRLFFRLPGRGRYAPTLGDTFKYDGKTYYFDDYGGWAPADASKNLPARFVAYSSEIMWGVFGADERNWMFSFEENEGYDSDHDAMSDSAEAAGKLRTASDLQDANSPNRRQAMYFQGPGRPSALQTPPEIVEMYPVSKETWPEEPTFLQFTVEAWANSESADDATVVERAIWCDPSKAGDEEYVRKNFQLGIKNGKWYARYDGNGTLAETSVEVFSRADVEIGKWHHLAATFDGARFILYVDGREAATPVDTSLQPEYGSSAMVFHRSSALGPYPFQPGDHWYEMDYALRPIVVGASLKTQAEGGSVEAFDVHNGAGWGKYTRFFKGFIDEVRIWDGARLATDILADVNTRYTREMAIANRTTFYEGWVKYGNRYGMDYNGDPVSIVPELRYHFSFDSMPGGYDEGVTAKVPAGFDYHQEAIPAINVSERGAAYLSRPLDWDVSWWTKVVGGDGSAESPGYGSVYDSADWVQWVPNTVAHLPRFDGTTLDSFFWSDSTCGDTEGSYYFAHTAEPASRWTQFMYNGVVDDAYYRTSGFRHHLTCDLDGLVVKSTGDDEPETYTNDLRRTSSRFTMFRFTGRTALQNGVDLLPLGGAYAKTCPSMWDDQGASTTWEITSDDDDNDGLPDAWENYAIGNYSPESTPVGWDTLVTWNGRQMTAGEAYRRDLAQGRILFTDSSGFPQVATTPVADLRQRADEDSSRTPDWWDDIYGVYGAGGTTDSDNDGLNNYVEYLVSEIFPFGMTLDPKMPKSDTETLDYFRKVGRLYLGEMFTDHDQMEDHWERSTGSDTIDANVWDAQRDGDEDGWSNFAENRYNGWNRSTLAQLISHTVGDTSTLDMPEPTIRLTARYNGRRDLTKVDSGSEGGNSGGSSGGDSKGAAPALHVLTYTDPEMAKADAEFVVRPGEEVSGEFYMGGWENRVIRGTLQPGYISYGDVDIVYTQLPQDDMYSWVDANGDLHISRPYSEFRDALKKDPDIIQNVTSFEWSHLKPASAYGATSEKAVTVTSGGYIAVYGERVGKIDLQTGDFEFDMAAMANLSFVGFYEGAEENAWGLKEAVYKLTYKAKMPDTELYKITASLATPESGFVKGGKSSIMAYWDIGGDGAYTPGTDPFGVVRDVEVGWCACNVEVELSDTSAVTPRIKLWEAAGSDRVARFNESPATNRFVAVDPATMPQNVRIRVVRFAVDNHPIWTVSTDPEVVFDKTYEKDVRDFIHEGDFFADGKFDVDWDWLEDDVYYNRIVANAGLDVTNMTYAIVVGDGDIEYYSDDDNYHTVYAHPYTITRRFEVDHTPPTAAPVNGESVCRVAQPTFSWRIDNEDPWASAFGTTYTAFKIKVKDLAGKEVYDSGYQRMPAADSAGVYSWTAPLYVDCPSPSGSHLVFHNLSNYTWQVFTYNAKFKTDKVGSMPQTFRMNVTELDMSSFGTAIDVRYTGPVTTSQAHGLIHVQMFKTPDFTGYPVAETVTAAPGRVNFAGLRAGTYFLRAYVDTDNDWTLDEWESWGYLSGRDVASVTGTKAIFNPVSVTVGPELKADSPRTIYIEDRDTDGDGFPDAWEAEQNGYVFNRLAIGPVTGDAEFFAVNTNLSFVLNSADTMDPQKKAQLMQMFFLSGKYGVSLLTGISTSALKSTASGALRVASSVVDDTVAITSLEIDRAAGEVVLGVGAETEADGSIDPVVAALYSISSDAEVTVKVYRTETLAADWGEPVAIIPNVALSSAGTEIRVKLPDGLDTSSGFFKVEIE